jgi:hypothetical protein
LYFLGRKLFMSTTKKLLICLAILSGCFFKASAQKVTVCNILVSGNHKTKTDIIIRELGFDNDDSLTVSNLKKTLERSKQNIINTNLFLNVEYTYTVKNDTLDLHIGVKERLYTIALPIFYLADRNFNEWWYDRNRDITRVTYGINAKHFNLTGNNDQLRVKAYGGFIPYFELSYGKPYIDKRKRIGLSGGVFYSTQRTMPYQLKNDKLNFYNSEDRMRKRVGAFTEFTLRNALYHFHSIYMGFTSISISDKIAELNPNYFGDGDVKQNQVSFIYDYKFDKRDNRQYPLHGHVFLARLSNNIIKTSKTYDQTSLYLLYSQYFQLKPRLFLESSLRGRVSSPREQPFAIQGGLGYGNNLVRGYELYVINGNQSFVSKTTLKHQSFKKTFDISRIIKMKQFNSFPLAVYPNVFFDFGYVKNNFKEAQFSKLSNKILTGSGFGLDFVTWYNTNIKMYYSFNNIGEKRFFFGIQQDI